MSDFNPYAPPSEDVVDRGPRWGGDSEGDGLWQERFLLVMERTAELPVDRCIVCDAPATGKPLRRKLSWHSSWWYLLGLVNLLVYAIAAMIVRRTVNLRVGLCDTHRKRRRMWIALAWGLVLVGIGLICSVLGNPMSETTAIALALLSLLSFLVAGFIGIYGPRVVYAKGIDDRHAWIGGVSSKFLNTLPEWDGPRCRG